MTISATLPSRPTYTRSDASRVAATSPQEIERLQRGIVGKIVNIYMYKAQFGGAGPNTALEKSLVQELQQRTISTRSIKSIVELKQLWGRADQELGEFGKKRVKMPQEPQHNRLSLALSGMFKKGQPFTLSDINAALTRAGVPIEAPKKLKTPGRTLKQGNNQLARAVAKLSQQNTTPQARQNALHVLFNHQRQRLLDNLPHDGTLQRYMALFNDYVAPTIRDQVLLNPRATLRGSHAFWDRARRDGFFQIMNNAPPGAPLVSVASRGALLSISDRLLSVPGDLLTRRTFRTELSNIFFDRWLQTPNRLGNTPIQVLLNALSVQVQNQPQPLPDRFAVANLIAAIVRSEFTGVGFQPSESQAFRDLRQLIRSVVLPGLPDTSEGGRSIVQALEENGAALLPAMLMRPTAQNVTIGEDAFLQGQHTYWNILRHYANQLVLPHLVGGAGSRPDRPGDQGDAGAMSVPSGALGVNVSLDPAGQLVITAPLEGESDFLGTVNAGDGPDGSHLMDTWKAVATERGLFKELAGAMTMNPEQLSKSFDVLEQLKQGKTLPELLSKKHDTEAKDAVHGALELLGIGNDQLRVLGSRILASTNTHRGEIVSDARPAFEALVAALRMRRTVMGKHSSDGNTRGGLDYASARTMTGISAETLAKIEHGGAYSGSPSVVGKGKTSEQKNFRWAHAALLGMALSQVNAGLRGRG